MRPFAFGCAAADACAVGFAALTANLRSLGAVPQVYARLAASRNGVRRRVSCRTTPLCLQTTLAVLPGGQERPQTGPGRAMVRRLGHCLHAQGIRLQGVR